MAKIYEIPLSAEPQRFSVSLSGTTYRMALAWRDAVGGGWVLDIATSDGVPLVSGIPLVTGADLLAQYRHLGFVGSLAVQTDHDPDAAPTFVNLGDTAHLYYIA